MKKEEIAQIALHRRFFNGAILDKERLLMDLSYMWFKEFGTRWLIHLIMDI